MPGLWSRVLAGGSLLHQAFGVVLLGLLGPRRTATLQESPNQDREGGRARSIQENGDESASSHDDQKTGSFRKQRFLRGCTAALKSVCDS